MLLSCYQGISFDSQKLAGLQYATDLNQFYCIPIQLPFELSKMDIVAKVKNLLSQNRGYVDPNVSEMSFHLYNPQLDRN